MLVDSVGTDNMESSQRISLEEITADSGEDKKGDVLIHIPEDLDRRLKDYLLQKWYVCTRRRNEYANGSSKPR
jgi:hypothetical protein